MNAIRTNKLFLILLLNLVSWLYTSAQNFVFSPFELRSELNEEQIRFVNQLPDGRLVILTESSTNLYNIGAVKNIPVDTVNFLPVKDYGYNHFCYVDDEYIWIKNQRTLSIVNIRSEKYEASPGKLLSDLGFPDKPKDLFLDAQKNIWLVSVKDQLFYYDRNKKRVSLFLPNVKRPENPADVLSNVIRLDDKIYLLYKSGLVRCFGSTTSKELYTIILGKKEHTATSSISYVSAFANFLYVIIDGYGSGGHLVRFNTLTRETTVLIKTDRQKLNNLVFDKQGNFWVAGTDGYWYFKANVLSGDFHPGIVLKDGYRVNSNISSVFYDKQEGIWMATNKGLYYYNPYRFSFSDYSKSIFQFNGSNDLKVFCFAELQDKLLIGTLNGIYKEASPEADRPNFDLLIPEIKCHTLFKSSSGIIWIGAEDGLYALTAGGKISRVLNIYPYTIIEASEGKLIIGTSDHGLLQYDERTGGVVSLFSYNALPDIRQLIKWNNLWVGFCNNGLFFIDPSKNKLRYANEDRKSMPAGLPPEVRVLVCLFADKEGLLWMGTYGGLYVWDYRNENLYKLSKAEGLVNNSIKAVIQDAGKSIWVTTSKGISRIERSVAKTGFIFKIHNYNENDGISKHASIGRSVYMAQNQQLYFGNLDGFNFLKPSKQSEARGVPAVIFNFKIFGRAVEEGVVYNKQVILEAPLAVTKNVTLNHDQNFISIQYTGLNYINPEKTYFRHQLVGVDKQWRENVPGENAVEATYTNLPPGDYVFRIMASSDGNHWPVAARELTIKIKSPFWATIYAKIFYIIAIVLIGWFLMKKHNVSQMKQRLKLQAEAVEREKNKFLTNISHDLRTPLTLIITPLRSLIPKISDDRLQADLKRIESNADLLLETVNELLEFKKIDESGEVLHASYIKDLSFLSEIASNYSQLVLEKNIDFEINIDNTVQEVWLDKKKVTRIVMNLLSNAFKFTPNAGAVIMNAFMNAERELVITVADTGIGIPQSETAMIFDRFYKAGNQDDANTGSGIGLYLVKRYAELHNGYVTVSSEPSLQTIFKVVLNVVRPEQKRIEPDIFSKKSILIVEDNRVFLEFLETELAEKYIVFTAQNGKDGLDLAVDKQPDLIITDMMMPEMNGIELCINIRNDINVSHTPIIMLTARASDKAQYEGYEAGADAYLVKPFDMDMLKLRIRKLMQMFLERQKLFSNGRNIQSATLTTNPLDKDLLERAVNCVNQNLANTEYTVEKFSAEMHMDRTGLYRKLMALTGQSPRDFIRTIRLNRAAELLRDPNAIVSQVAEEVGFNSVSYFSKSFQEKFGVSPSQYGQ